MLIYLNLYRDTLKNTINYHKITHLILGVVNTKGIKIMQIIKNIDFETEEVRIIEMWPFSIEKWWKKITKLLCHIYAKLIRASISNCENQKHINYFVIAKISNNFKTNEHILNICDLKKKGGKIDCQVVIDPYYFW